MAGIFVILVCALGLASSTPTTSTYPISANLIWGNCTIFNVTDANPNLSCGYFQVPMDYFDSAAGEARLAIMKYQATMPKKKGTLFVNPGGPGGSGIEFITSLGVQMSKEFQGQYDIVSWDPRGVGSYTFPGEVTCFNTYAEQMAFWDNSVVRSINETISTNFSDPNEFKEFFSRLPETNAKLEELGKRCLASKTGPYFQYIGSISTIRDLVSLADNIVGPGQPVDYYGYSYGTVIGFHFLSLYPDRIGHFILDGVVDPNKWARYDFEYDSAIHIEAAFTTFVTACAEAGAAKCLPVQLINKTATGSEVRTLITSTIDLALKLQTVGYTQLPAQAAEIKAYFFRSLYFPSLWPTIMNQEVYFLLVTILQAGRAHGFTDPYILPQNPVPPIPELNFGLSYSRPAIVGADAVASNGVPLKEVFQNIVAITRDRTPTLGAVWSAWSTALKWPVRSVEKLPIFTHKVLNNRVLLIGNTIDPITPLENAEYVSNLLGSSNAVLVELQAVGHTTLAQESNCTKNIILNFLLNSQLPQQNTKCAPNSNDFFPDAPTNARLVLPRTV